MIEVVLRDIFLNLVMRQFLKVYLTIYCEGINVPKPVPQLLLFLHLVTIADGRLMASL